MPETATLMLKYHSPPENRGYMATKPELLAFCEEMAIEFSKRAEAKKLTPAEGKYCLEAMIEMYDKTLAENKADSLSWT